MDTYLIIENAEDLFNASIPSAGEKEFGAKTDDSINFVLCKFFQINCAPDAKRIQALIDKTESLGSCSIYLFKDHDVILAFQGVATNTQNAIISDIGDIYETHISPHMYRQDFFARYNFKNDHPKLKTLSMAKLGQRTKAGRELNKYFSNQGLIKTLNATLQIVSMQRAMRVNPVILAVEDQRFSQKLLTSILKDYTVHIAENSGEALLLYMEKCPDIVLLDIELPDLDGHEFAKLVNKIDPDHYIIMVSANHSAEDIARARENRSKRFIVKPYEKEELLRVVSDFRDIKKKALKKEKREKRQL